MSLPPHYILTGMDDKTTVAELRKRFLKFINDRDWKQFHNPKDVALDLATEVGEVLEHFKFKSNEEIKEILANPEKKKELSHEVADVLMAVLLLSDEIGIDLTTAFNEKLRINEKKYPVGLSKGVNRKYTELK